MFNILIPFTSRRHSAQCKNNQGWGVIRLGRLEWGRAENLCWFWVANWSTGQFSTIDFRSPTKNPTFLNSPFSHHEATKLHWSPSCKNYCFPSLYAKGKRLACGCVCEGTCLRSYLHHPPLSHSTRIQMSEHLSCKCLSVCFSSVCMCVCLTCTSVGKNLHKCR